MRLFGWSIASLPLVVSFAVAQPPPTRPAGQPPALVVPGAGVAPAANRLDTLLVQWEQKMRGVQSLVAVVGRIDIDPSINGKDEYRGQLKFLRPNRADLYMVKTTNPQVYERFLCTGNSLFEYLPKQELIRQHQLPQRAAGQPIVDNSFIGFLAGMSAIETKRRFDMTLMKEDQWYAYLEVKPKLPDDKAEFSVARIALLQSTMMPAELQFVHPNGTINKWTIEKMDVNKDVPATDFATPKLPPKWRMDQVGPPGAPKLGPAPAPPPTKVRPNGS